MSLFESQAWYLIAREDPSLFSTVLDSKYNGYSSQMIDAIIKVTPQVSEATKVASVVRAFMYAELVHELIQLLESILFSPQTQEEFKTNSNLANLLMLTALKVGKSNDDLCKYLDRLKNISSEDLAMISISMERFEIAVRILKRAEQHERAMEIILNQMKDPKLAREYLEETNDSKARSKFEEWEKNNLR